MIVVGYYRDLLFNLFSAVGVKKVLETDTGGSCITQLIYLMPWKHALKMVTIPYFM